MRRSLQSPALFLGFIAACIILAGIGLSTYQNTHQLVRSFGSVSESHKAIEKLQTIQELLQSAESSAYNYVITGREDRLMLYQRASSQIPSKLRDVEMLLKGNARQTRELKQFRRLYSVHQDYLTKIVDERKEHGFEAAAQWVSAENDQSIRDILHIVLDEVQKEQAKVIRRRAASSSEHSSETQIYLISALGVVFLLVAAIFGWLRRETGERHVVETENVKLETFLRSIVERIPYMVLVKEANTLRITLANKAAAEWLGKTEEELLGSNDYDLWPEENARQAINQDREVLQRGEAIDIPEEKFVREGKEERILHTQKVSIPDEEGDPAFLLVISEDITLRKHAEHMLEISRDAAVQSERLKSEFIRNMSHEIRTPLSIVVGMTSILLDTNLSPEQRAFATKVETSANSLARLTKSILDFSRIESGTFAMEMQEMNLRTTIDGITGMMSQQAKTKGVDFVSLVPPSVPQTLIGDPIRLRQVLTELIGNALKFTDKGEVIIRVMEEEQNDQQIWFKIKVTDTGMGIDLEKQKYLFEPFRQGDGSATRRFGGTGLGLAISKKIVELMGGKIGFSSAPKEGSTFWCLIPFKRRADTGHSAKITSPSWTRARLLIVDENEISRQSLWHQLKAWSLFSETVSNGEAALKLLKNEYKAGRPFQIVMLDMQLSDMEGVAFAKAIKTDPALAPIRLVVFTENEIDASTAQSLGFSETLVKPPKTETLYERLSHLIESPDPEHQSAA